LEVVDVRKSFGVETTWKSYSSVLAVEGVSAQAWEGKTLAIAGESGCGKSTLGRMLLGLVPPDQGEIRFDGRPLDAFADSHWRDFRRSVQMVFQNPLASFNPMLTVGGSITDAMRLRNDLSSSCRKSAAAASLLGQMRLDPALLDHYPAEMSAGQLQKASIARALATRPRIVFLDEPTSALDASGCRQIIDLLLGLQSDLGLGYVLVSHDFHVIRKLAHHVVVMYLGQVVEEGPAEAVLNRPRHPYTQALLAASSMDLARDSKWRLRGELSKLPIGYPGCRLVRRCSFAQPACENQQSLVPIGHGHRVRCGRAEEIANEPRIAKTQNH
jgi:oligopeptide/dipeptide ABC transporter ATP-binding protein